MTPRNSSKGRKRRAPPPPEERLVAKIEDWKCSYYIGQYGYGSPIDDEAITNLNCRIAEADHRHREHVGQVMELSFVCARRYAEDKKEPGRPALYDVTLRKNQRSLLLYLPSDTYWAAPAMIDRWSDPCVELSFERLHRGYGALRSLWLGGYENLLHERAAIAELIRAN